MIRPSYGECRNERPRNARMHLASRLFLDDYAVGNLATEEFQRLFSLPNSRYLALGKCLVDLHQ